ncbi:phytanoyl-CoA dioxygenase family protein [Phycisphaera mikurensis]|uniref:Phytanoyl-CoA dioxygenase n=1 Tax=Phycisphaera mikurensis (strain NBRC 102666 / KCTC 22515 / FYK2301M01) TaxID=1142394 RepID=I0IJA0_PHYMF|nr:phytanoyl-CoA dioxygenase family protein [Phycisphaera mikurensis]MBB6441862.1 hypothetical protein [Phycisphaera mikurensis]BAM05338.1 hypothetical protein PSMK_31790 [Phycisphaera mikurensis NBRC 102666]
MTTSTPQAPPAPAVPAAIRQELQTPMEPTPEQVRRFRTDGYLKWKDFFSPELLAFFDPIVTACLHDRNPLKDVPMEQRSAYDRAFIQVPNLWTFNDTVRELSTSVRAASAASRLLGTTGVRMYHDQALYKEAGGGFTPWHVDQHYWPIGTEKTVTIWFPFTEVPVEKGPLMFGKESHHKHIAREVAISEDSEKIIGEAIKSHRVVEEMSGYGLGEVSFHYGWTLHRAAPNTTDDSRRVLTVIYVAEDAEVIEPKYDAHRSDLREWMPGLKPGDAVDSPLNPVLFREASA